MFKHEYSLLKYIIYITSYLLLTISVFITLKFNLKKISGTNGSAKRKSAKYMILLIFSVYTIILPTSIIHGLHGDEINHIWLSESILKDFDLNLINNVPQDKHYLVAHYYFKSAKELYTSVMPGLSILAQPFYFLAGVAGFRFLMVLLSCILIYFLFLISSDYTGSIKISFIFSIIYAFLNPLIIYSSQLYPEIIAALCIVLTLYFIDRNKPVLSGLVISLVLWFHIKYIIILSLFIIIVFINSFYTGKNKKFFLLFIIPVFLLFSIYELYCFKIFGSTNPFAAYVQGSDAGYTNFYNMFYDIIINNNILEQCRINLFDIQFGLFVNCPLYVFGIISIFYCSIILFSKYWKISIIFFGYALYIFSNNQGYNGYSPLNRLLVPVLPLLIITSSELFLKIGKTRNFIKNSSYILIIFLFLISFIISSVFVIVPISRYPDYFGKNSIIWTVNKIFFKH